MTAVLARSGFEVSGLSGPERVRAWSRAWAASGIADAASVPEQATDFHGRIRRRSLHDLVVVDVEADPFTSLWDSTSVAAGYVGISVNTRRFRERVVYGDRREFVATSSVDVWDPTILVESEVLGPMAQKVLLVPKTALHMGKNCSLLLRDAHTEHDQALLRLLRSVVLSVAADADRFGASAAVAARNAVVDLLLSVVQERRQPSGVAVSESMRLAVSRWVDENLHLGQLSPAQAAEKHGISVRSLHRLFSDSGDSFGSLVRRRRLDRAGRDLLQTDDMVQSIAMRWGYADASQFINEFKRAHGSTPAAHRKARRATG
ncbi:helix-turn-helix transcriptional regulator [Blastococcus sp. SYSU D00695]